jgi:hypothetical protein
VHGLARETLEPEEPRIPEHDHQRVARAPRQAHLGEIDLGLLPGRRLEADRLLGRGHGPDAPHEHFHLRQAPSVAGRPHFLEEPHRGQLGIRVEALADEGVVRIQLGRTPGIPHGGHVDVALEIALGDPLVDTAAADADPLGNGGLGKTLLQIVTQQHTRLPTVHRVSTTLGVTRICERAGGWLWDQAPGGIGTEYALLAAESVQSATAANISGNPGAVHACTRS